MDLVFYDGNAISRRLSRQRLRGSQGLVESLRADGYKVVRVPFKDGRPVGSYENFMTGFWVSGRARAEVWGRPAAIALAKDGALLVADDVAGTICARGVCGGAAQGAGAGPGRALRDQPNVVAPGGQPSRLARPLFRARQRRASSVRRRQAR